MPTAWRLVKRRHGRDPLDGRGARMHGGRWNSPGIAVIYGAESRALAALEVLARTESAALLEAFLLIAVSFPDTFVSGIGPRELPPRWRATPPGGESQAVGDAWVRRGASVVLRVPSVMIPAEHNYLLNPAHPDFGRLEIAPPEEFGFDPRLT